MKTKFEFPEVKKKCSPNEWKARCELAAVFRLAHKLGWTDIIYNHFSVRLPGSMEFFIHPLGIAFDEICASNLVKVNCDGDILQNPIAKYKLLPNHATPYQVIHGAWVIHGGIHLVRPEINCVLHTHNQTGLAVSAMKCGLLPITQHAMAVQEEVTYHDYEGVVTSPAERTRLSKRLGKKSKAMILKNHGLLTLGESVAEAFHYMYYLDAACKAQIDAMSGGIKNLNVMSRKLAHKTSEDFRKYRKQMIEMEWSALLRGLVKDGIRYDY